MLSTDDFVYDLISNEYLDAINKFYSIEDSMNKYLKHQALNDNEIGENKTYLVFDKDKKHLIGYFSLRASAMNLIEDFEDGKPPNYRFLPCVEISRLAIQREYKSQNIGKSILEYAISLINNFKNKKLGVMVIILFAINKNRVLKFYKDNGFEEFQDHMDFVKCSSNRIGEVKPMFYIL